jgi:hypothetical protein
VYINRLLSSVRLQSVFKVKVFLFFNVFEACLLATKMDSTLYKVFNKIKNYEDLLENYEFGEK